MTMATIEVFKSTNGQFRFRVKANNGEIIATGESYKQKQKVMQVLRSLKSAVNGKVVDLTQPVDRKPTAKSTARPSARRSGKATVAKGKSAASRSKAAPKKAGTRRPKSARPAAPLARGFTSKGQAQAAAEPVDHADNLRPQAGDDVQQTPVADEAGDTV
jgi:uncharacterized protein YegP (UPF0339 family)